MFQRRNRTSVAQMTQKLMFESNDNSFGSLVGTLGPRGPELLEKNSLRLRRGRDTVELGRSNGRLRSGEMPDFTVIDGGGKGRGPGDHDPDMARHHMDTLIIEILRAIARGYDHRAHPLATPESIPLG